MKPAIKQIKLDKTKLFGFNQTASGKAQAKTRPMIGSKAIGSKGGGGSPPPEGFTLG